MQQANDDQLIEAMRALQHALEKYDHISADALSLGRSDAACLSLLVDEGALAPRELGKRLALTSGSVTALIDRLEVRGLAIRAPDPSDRRALKVSASRQGERAITRSRKVLGSLSRRVVQRVGADKSAAIIKQINDLARLTQWASEHKI